MKNLLGLGFVGALLPLAGSTLIAPAGQAGADSSDEIQDVVFLGERPLLIRFHIEIDGKPLRAVWNEAVSRVFKTLDKDGKGALTAKEIRRMPPPFLFC